MFSASKIRSFFYTQAFFASIFYLWVCIAHYISSILYVKMCTPTTAWGFFTSPFMVMTPQCSALSWAAQNSRAHLLNMWILLGNFGISVCASAVLYATKKSPHDNNAPQLVASPTFSSEVEKSDHDDETPVVPAFVESSENVQRRCSSVKGKKNL